MAVLSKETAPHKARFASCVALTGVSATAGVKRHDESHLAKSPEKHLTHLFKCYNNKVHEAGEQEAHDVG